MVVIALLATPLAIAAAASACNPQAHIVVSPTSVEAGASLTVHGSYFPATSRSPST